MRVANRAHTDALLLAVLDEDRPFDEWTYLEDVADNAGLTFKQALRAAHHLALEYAALELLPMSKAVMLRHHGFRAYEAHNRKYHPDRLGERERHAIVRRVSLIGGQL